MKTCVLYFKGVITITMNKMYVNYNEENDEINQRYVYFINT